MGVRIGIFVFLNMAFQLVPQNLDIVYTFVSLKSSGPTNFYTRKT